MSIFKRQWLAPSPDVVFNPLSIGVAFLVNIGYGGPIPEDQPVPHGVRGITAPVVHVWPPHGLTESTPRRVLLRHVLQTAQGVDDAALAGLGASIDGLAKRPDDAIFESQFADHVDDPLIATGVCLAPAVVAGDTVVELVGERIHIGDIVTVVLRGALMPLTKIFAGLVDREGHPAALFYLKNPEQVIEVPLADVVYAAKVKPPRELDGHAMLANADPFVGQWHQRFHLADSMGPVGSSRTAAWVESMKSIFEVVRRQPY